MEAGNHWRGHFHKTIDPTPPAAADDELRENLKAGTWDLGGNDANPFPFPHSFLHRIPLIPRDPGPDSVLSALTQPSFRREVVLYAVRTPTYPEEWAHRTGLHEEGWNRGHPWVVEMTRGQGLGSGYGQTILRKFSKLLRESQEQPVLTGSRS